MLGILISVILIISIPVGVFQGIRQNKRESNLKACKLLEVVGKKAIFEVEYQNGKSEKLSVAAGSNRYMKLKEQESEVE